MFLLLRLPVVVKCQELRRPTRGSVKCSNPLGPNSYRSTCEFTCDEGYVLVGSSALQCEASGLWSSSQPSCVGTSAFITFKPRRALRIILILTSSVFPFVLKAAKCPALQELENGAASCGADRDTRFHYGNTCSFTCAPGYRLVGPSAVTCTSAAQWNEQMPRCEGKFIPPVFCVPTKSFVGAFVTSSLQTCFPLTAITCKNPEGEAHLVSQCSHPLTRLRPESSCSFRCEAGFELQGEQTVHCSADGRWSKALPTCKGMEHSLRRVPPHSIF